MGGDMRIKLISIIIGFVDKAAQDSVKARKNGSSSFVWWLIKSSVMG